MVRITDFCTVGTLIGRDERRSNHWSEKNPLFTLARQCEKSSTSVALNCMEGKNSSASSDTCLSLFPRSLNKDEKQSSGAR